MIALTPVENRGGVWVKRDDLFSFAGICGGKVRSCLAIATGDKDAKGLVTASSRVSPQMQIVSRVGQALGLPVRCHIPQGADTPEIQDAVRHGATIVRHTPGHNSVICARAHDDALCKGWVHVPFGMEHLKAITATFNQARALCQSIWSGEVPKPKKIVVPVGSGMTAVGIAKAVDTSGLKIPLVGVQTGGNPVRRISTYMPSWPRVLTLVSSKHDYHEAVEARLDGILLDPHYEAKCMEFIDVGDLFWIVGIRAGLGDVPK